jgi:hypothetical protein
MLVGPVHQEEVWTRSSQRVPARSNIHTSTTGFAPEAAVHPGSLFFRSDNKRQKATRALHRMAFARLSLGPPEIPSRGA